VAFLSGFDHDVFISYAHLNNQKLANQDRGWVAEFGETLGGLLRAQHREFTLWEDKRLLAGEEWDESIPEAIRASAVFLAIFSAAWRDSTYCPKELDIFRTQILHDRFGPVVKESGRTFARVQGVILQDVPVEKQPPELRKTTPARFATGGLGWLSRPQVADMDARYFQEMARVVESILRTLETMASQIEKGTAIEAGEPAHTAGTLPAVYLADVTDDLLERREELQKMAIGVRDLPDGESAIERTALSIHLLNATAGRTLPGQQVSRSRLQLEMAKARGAVWRPLVWIAKDLDFSKVGNQAHRQFLEGLEDGAVELIRCDWEDFKVEVNRRLAPPESVSRKTLRDRRRPGPLIYVSALDQANRSSAGLEEQLSERGCGVFLLNLAQATEEIRQKHQRTLRKCDGFVVPYNAQTQSQAEDLVMEAWDSMRNSERPKGIAVVETAPPSTQEFGFRGPSVATIKAAEDIASFLRMLEG
jgi:hypothetical protein